jgi:hypothetical protein
MNPSNMNTAATAHLHPAPPEIVPNAPLEFAITRVLDQQPDFAVPDDFSARVRAALPAMPSAQRSRSLRVPVAAGAAATALAAMFLLAPHSAASFSNVVFDVELLLLAEVSCIASWLMTRQQM